MTFCPVCFTHPLRHEEEVEEDEEEEEKEEVEEVKEEEEVVEVEAQHRVPAHTEAAFGRSEGGCAEPRSRSDSHRIRESTELRRCSHTQPHCQSSSKLLLAFKCQKRQVPPIYFFFFPPFLSFFFNATRSNKKQSRR